MGRVAEFFSSQGITLPQEQRRQMLALDRECSQMEAKIKVIEAENLKLQAKVNPLEREIERLKQQIQQQSTATHGQELPPESITIIKLLASVRHGEMLTAEDIAGSIRIHPTRAEHFLTTLAKSEYLYVSYSSIEPPSYCLDDKGRESLASPTWWTSTP